MKKLLTMFLVLFTVNVFAATAVLRQGTYIEQYNISDPGNVSGFDNNRVFISWKTAEVVIQVSGANKHTSSESLYCWEDPDVIECPDDDIGGGVLRSPVLVFLNNIMLERGVTIGARLNGIAERSIYLAFWHEYRTKRLVTTSVARMALDGLNATQQRRALKFIYFGNGIDIVTAQSLANARINSGTVATYDQYNLNNIPIQDRRLIKLFGEAGWFL